MQILRCILMACVTAAALLPFALPAQDNDAQAKAREALEQQAQGSTDQPAIQGQTPSSPATNQPAQPPARKETPKRPAPPATAKSPSHGHPAVAKPVALEGALHQKIDTRTNEPSASAPAPAQEDTSWATVTPGASGADPNALAKAREALHQKMADMNGQPGQSTAAGTRPEAPMAGATANAEPPASIPNSRDAAVAAAVKEASRANNTKVKQKETETVKPTVPLVQALPGLEPLSAPPLPISASKDQRLQQLLQDYKADLLSPEQYHAQRAKILAEP